MWFWGAWLSDPKDRLRAYTEHVLPLLDRLALALGEPVDMEAGLPTSTFYAHFYRGMLSGEAFQLPNWKPIGSYPGSYYPRRRIWRTISPAETRTKENVGKDAKTGYWIGETGSDMLDGWIVTNELYWE